MTTRVAWLRVHALLSLATLVTFARALPYPLQRSWDDGRFILDNPDVRTISWHALRAFFTEPQFQAYHPLHLLSYWLDVPWCDADPLVLHAVSLALYLVAANVALRVLAALGFSPAVATIAGCAWVLHPVQVEAVSWATGRKDVLALLFASACMLAHLRSQRFGDRAAWLSRGAYGFSLLSKTTAVPLPALLVLLDMTLRKRPLKQALRDQIPSFVIALGVGAYVVALWQDEQMLRASAEAGLIERVVVTLGHQLGTALWPSRNAPMYTTEPRASASDWLIAIGLLVTLGIALRLRARRTLFAIGAFVLLLLPVCNVVPMYFPFQDRYLSLPLFGLAYGFAAALHALPRSVSSRGLVLGAGAALALSARALQYQGVWHDELRLWGHAASVQPDAYYALMKLGEVRRDAGAFDGAIRAYQRVLALDSQRKLGHVALFQAVALRDERLRGLAPSEAEAYARTYYGALEDPDRLRALAARMLERGYLRAPELPLGRALASQPFPDSALERAAGIQFAAGRPSLALFYLRQMRRPTRSPELNAAAERARAALVTAPVL